MNPIRRQPTAFQQRIYNLICHIPKGHVITYGALAKDAGCGSAQAVGQALKKNPDGPEVP